MAEHTWKRKGRILNLAGHRDVVGGSLAHSPQVVFTMLNSRIISITSGVVQERAAACARVVYVGITDLAVVRINL